MNIETGREFSFTNPQDDPHLYPKLPIGFSYDIYGKIRGNQRIGPILKPDHVLPPKYPYTEEAVQEILRHNRERKPRSGVGARSGASTTGKP